MIRKLVIFGAVIFGAFFIATEPSAAAHYLGGCVQVIHDVSGFLLKL